MKISNYFKEHIPPEFRKKDILESKKVKDMYFGGQPLI